MGYVLEKLVGDQALLVTSHIGDSAIQQLDVPSGKLLTYFNNEWSPSLLQAPRGMARNEAGVAIATTTAMNRYRLDGTLASQAYFKEVTGPHGATFDAAGNFLVALAASSNVARVDETSDNGFTEVWRVPGVDEGYDNRCHLNGVTCVDGKLKYVSALAISNTPGNGWKIGTDWRVNGGVIIDVDTNETVISGLSMPHSPVWRGDTLWFLNSRKGELCKWQPGQKYEVVANINGFSRGLCFLDDTHVAIGVSRGRIAAAADLSEIFKNAIPGVVVTDITTGEQVDFAPLDEYLEETFEILLNPVPLVA